MSDKLKPCAHCAKPGIEVEQRRGNLRKWSIECSGCGCCTDWYGSLEYAIAAWNKRADELSEQRPMDNAQADTLETKRKDKVSIDHDGNVTMYLSPDNREQLEAEITKKACAYKNIAGTWHPEWMECTYDDILRWLDRQAVITRRECGPEAIDYMLKSDAKRWMDAANEQRLVAMEQADKVQELAAERDELHGKMEAEHQLRLRWKAQAEELEAENKRLRDSEACAGCENVTRTIDELTAKRDQLNTRCNDLETERDDLLHITKELKKDNDELLEGRAHWTDQAVSIYRHFYPHDEYGVPADVSSMVLAKIAELEIERNMLRKAARKLTAEQVRECVQDVYYEGYNDGSIHRGHGIEETDWQTIADKLNATLSNQERG